MSFTINQALKLLPRLIGNGITTELESDPGIGKSSLVVQMKDQLQASTGLNWGIGTHLLALYQPVDVNGFMVPHDHPKYGLMSKFTMPAWMMSDEGIPLTEYDRFILFFDEFHQADPDVKKAVANVLLEGRIGQYKFDKKKVAVITAGNLSDGRNGVTKDFDFRINRVRKMRLHFDLQSWTDWAFKKGVPPVFITFANEHPEIFEPRERKDYSPWCTPRSFVACAEDMMALADASGLVPTDAAAQEVAAGTIGSGPCAQLFAYIKLGNETPSYSEIISNPTKVKVPNRADAQMLVAYTLAARVSSKDVDPVVTYMDRMPKEFAVTFAKAACRRDTTLVDTDTFGSWAAKNAALMQAIIDVSN